MGGVRLGAIYAAHGASHGFVLVLPAVLVALRAEFGASFTTLGTIATLSTMLYGPGAAGGVVADRAGLAAVFGFLGLVAIVNTLGGLAVRLLLGRSEVSTTTPPRA